MSSSLRLLRDFCWLVASASQPPATSFHTSTMARFDVPSLASLTVIPEIRLTDKSLVLCPEMKLVPLFEIKL